MVTHRIANFIMLISNLPSVRSSRFKPNVGSRVIRLSLSFSLSLSLSHFSFFILQSHHVLLLSNKSVVACFTHMYSHQDDDDDEDYNLLLRIFFFVSTHLDTYIRCIRSPSGETKKRVAPLPLRQLNSCIFFPSFSFLFFASVIFFFCLFPLSVLDVYVCMQEI